MDISVVIPCFNESSGVRQFWDRLARVMDDITLSWEAVFVNDGSADSTLAKLKEIRESHGNCRIIDLSRNFGKEAAITAGLDYSTGSAVIVIDADLQHPPEVIGEMVALWKKGAEVVMGRRKQRTTDSLMRRWFSKKFYTFAQRLFVVSLPRDVGDFRLMDRIVVEKIGELKETERFMKGLFAWIGFRQVIVDFEVEPRSAGTSNFSSWKLWNLALQGITSFSTAPLRIWFYIGLIISTGSILYAIFVLIHSLLYGTNVPGYPSIIILVGLIGGLQLIGIGILGEYLGRTYMESKGRPIYVVRDEFEN
ncbi:MAG: glycosyltransferase family 2 protein [Halioglobus sp.]